MKHFSITLLLALFAGFSLVLSACGDSKKADPTPTTGTLNGQITPAAGVTTVTATDAANKTTTTTPNASGAYSFSALAAGTYTVSFTPAAGYAAPANQNVTITAGGTTTANPVTPVTSSSTGGTGTFTVAGVTTTGSLVTANYFSNNLSVTIASTTGRSLVMNIDGFANAAGTFSLSNPSTASQLIYSEQVGTAAQQWTTASFLSGGLGTGTAVITSIGSNPRRVSGTFTATAYPATSASTGTRTITGSFTNVAY